MCNTYQDRSKYDTRHGGPFDRGSADSYYNRPRSPHYYIGDTYKGEPIVDLNLYELEAYNAGYNWNEEFGDKKEYI